MDDNYDKIIPYLININNIEKFINFLYKENIINKDLSNIYKTRECIISCFSYTRYLECSFNIINEKINYMIRYNSFVPILEIKCNNINTDFENTFSLIGNSNFQLSYNQYIFSKFIRNMKFEKLREL